MSQAARQCRAQEFGMFRPFRIEIIAATWILALTGGLAVFLAQLARVAVKG